MIDNKLWNITYTQKDSWTGEVKEFTCNVVAESSSSAQEVINQVVPGVQYMKVNKSAPVHAFSSRCLRAIAYSLFDTVREEKEAALTQKKPKPVFQPYVNEKEPVQMEPSFSLLQRKM